MFISNTFLHCVETYLCLYLVRIQNIEINACNCTHRIPLYHGDGDAVVKQFIAGFFKTLNGSVPSYLSAPLLQFLSRCCQMLPNLGTKTEVIETSQRPALICGIICLILLRRYSLDYFDFNHI